MIAWPTRTLALIAVPLLALGAGACAKKGELVIDSGVGVTALRSSCPTVGVPNYTGDVTLFTAPGRTDAGAIDVVASMTDLRSQCSESTDKIYTAATFEVLGRRTDVRGARQVQLPYFITVVRGGSAVVSKRVGTVTLDFADGQERAQGRGQAAAYVDRAEATLPADIRAKITAKRKAGDESAAVDPLNEPDVRAALARASFELLVGFQMNEQQLTYNATR
ncbi:hypothetical protein ACFO0A_05735 [Novosphingobium tardum]|uniref:Lipoprotein n=1 Tax=Novosphingobium tardum TaxID=1538021 RepID=A0ABV8RP01_9SPHN